MRSSLVGLLALALAGCDEGSESTPAAATGTGGSVAIACGDGEVAVGDGCVSVGVPECGAGFVAADGGCSAIVPDACGDGELALLGETTCAELVDCGEDKWGNIARTADTVYVDASYTAPDADGSIDRPFPTLLQATEAVPAGATIAITDGVYHEQLLPSLAGAPIVVAGRCPELVEIAGTGEELIGSVEITSPAFDTVIRGVSVTSSGGFGITLSGVTGVVIEDVWVHDTLEAGIILDDQLGDSGIALRRVLVERARGAGVQSRGGDVEIDALEVRDTIPSDAGAGVGISLLDTSTHASSGIVRSSYLHGLVGTGIGAQGTTLNVEDSFIADVAAIVSSELDGVGIVAATGFSGEGLLTLNGVVVERSHEAGVILVDVDAVIERTTIRDVFPQAADGRGGAGVALVRSAGGVTNTLELRDSLIERATGFGVLINDADATLERVWVRDSAPMAADDLFGDGVILVSLDQRGTLTIAEVLVQESSRAGVSNFGGDVSIRDSRLLCNVFDLDGEITTVGSSFFEDRGGNQCGCAEPRPCKASSANLAPPEAP